ncbi:MAG: RNA polymerase sigma-54 factor [Myxococcales bacterium]|nr:MAG: RNA polymerase sigma-54 factor [Myxococcales bacterium]
MALKLELNMKLQQQLVMTPQLQMAIKLLQMTRMELAEAVTQELEENPTLEEGFEEIDLAAKKDGAGNGETTWDGEEPKLSPLEAGTILPGAAQDADTLMARDLAKNLSEAQSADANFDWDTYFDRYMDGPSDIMPRDSGDEDRPGFEQFYAAESTLSDYLIWQLKFSSLPDDHYAVGEEIVGNINDDGYLQSLTLEEIAERCNQPLAVVEAVHQRIQRFDPVGIGARDLRECLLAQARFSDKRHALAAQMLQDCWELVTKRNLLKIARTLKVSQDEVEEAMRAVASLDPRPGSKYSEEKTEFITPDIYVYKVGDDYHIQLNEDGLPRLRLSGYYQRGLANKAFAGKTREFIRAKLRSASWLIRSIQQRQRTIYRVTESIVKRQRDFFDGGIEHLHPMVLRDVAEDIEMHECTVSRVTTNKYVHTPQGIFELKFFFNSGILNAEGEGVASETIKTKIRSLIDKEDPKKPLSDQKLVQILKQDGVEVARRTVAKYREMLGILSSSGRRKTF